MTIVDKYERNCLCVMQISKCTPNASIPMRATMNSHMRTSQVWWLLAWFDASSNLFTQNHNRKIFGAHSVRLGIVFRYLLLAFAWVDLCDWFIMHANRIISIKCFYFIYHRNINTAFLFSGDCNCKTNFCEIFF